MSEIRTFLALPIPEQIKGYFKNMLVPIVDRQDKINWVKPENIHITLNYLGETDSDKIEEHALRIESVVNAFPTFQLGTTDTGIYPHANAPRVLWVGSMPYDLTLNAFKQKLDKELLQLGYTLDNRPFQPHITLARVKTISRKSTFIHKFLSAEVREFNFEVDTVVWMKSTLTPVGAEYEELKSFKFNSGGQ
ncbi:MAG: RNA 2',3'-cyclic phosphodiesterase [Candidatus Marinimicrobia bacterium]|nr:RNA 2',3'-cyclic phosphodiesterase [Candidatus Neomarinimicrobiota bacterium]MCF7921421.1 RNA 2',3'-cyclic phosphodiesterase [Candidatus Neomarinimicrobiota bacterium]